MLTLSAIKADVGSIGGHTLPSSRMMDVAQTHLGQAAKKGIIADFDVTHTGDDICLLMVHRHGDGHGCRLLRHLLGRLLCWSRGQ